MRAGLKPKHRRWVPTKLLCENAFTSAAAAVGGGASLPFGHQGKRERVVTARQRAETHGARASRGAQTGLR